MKKLSTMRRLHGDTKAVTALEYGLIAAAIAVTIVTAVGTLGNNLSSTFHTIATTLAPTT